MEYDYDPSVLKSIITLFVPLDRNLFRNFSRSNYLCAIAFYRFNGIVRSSNELSNKYPLPQQRSN